MGPIIRVMITAHVISGCRTLAHVAALWFERPHAMRPNLNLKFRARSPPAASGQLAPRAGGQKGAACQDRAARHVNYIGLEPYPPGTSTCTQWGSAQARSARGGAQAAAAVLSRHGGGWVAMARSSAAVRRAQLWS